MRILPQNLVLHGRRTLAAGLSLGFAFATLGCAKFPANGGTQHVHLIFTMTVAGHIQDGSQNGESPYVYIVAVNPSTDPNPIVTGPEPVIAQPWGNGFVAGTATNFVRYGLDQSSPYTVYAFTSPDMLAYGATGAPVSTSGPGANGSTIQFEVDMQQFVPIGVDPNSMQSIQVNFLTMNRVPQGGDSGSKVWDALGDGHNVNTVNDYILIPLSSSQIYNNQGQGNIQFQDLEPQGDCVDPNLDIINWSVEVRRP